MTRLYNKLINIIKPSNSYPVIYSANKVDESNYNKYALLIYIVKPFLVRDDDPFQFRHQHTRQCRQIAAILGELGFVVDVIDIGDKKFTPSRDYHLVICNRGVDTPLNKDVTRIYLATTLSHDIHNRNLLKRHDLLSEGRGCRVQLRRFYSDAMPYVERSDAIIGFGNEIIMNTWRTAFNLPAYPFNNYGLRRRGSLLIRRTSH